MCQQLTSNDASGRRDRIIGTILVYLSCFCYGLMAICLTTLLDVAELTHSTTALVSYGLSK